MSDYQTSKAYRVRQAPKRASYDRALVHSILDEGYVGHLAFMADGMPVALPMFYVRDGESVLLHGSRKSRLMQRLAGGAPLCLTVTHLDGLVLARSAFHHSMNYRSVMVHGCAKPLAGEEKARAMALITARVREGRPSGERPVNAQEAKATEMLCLPLIEVAAKVRTGGPLDDEEDMVLPVWAGVIPMQVVFGEPVRDVAPAPVAMA
jgi:nitroimidazol reductase NimA-like FMN-containing flavoprotein (pyridoxamine 5'-phosphate oxidase superfamily)